MGALARGFLSAKDVRRWNRQLPRRIAIHKWQIHEGPAVDFLLIVGYAIRQTKLLCDFVSSVAEKREVKFVLVRHQIVLVNCLRRDGDQRCSGCFNLRIDRIHRFHLPHAKRAPAPTDEADDERPALQQFRRAHQLAVVVLQFEFLGSVVRLQRTLGYAGLSELIDNPRVNRLNIHGNVLRNQFFALGVDFAEGARFFRRRFLE